MTNPTVIIPLVPLRIPSSWSVVYNNFCEADLITPEGMPQEREFFDAYFSEDILSLERVASTPGEASYAIDLGWYPAGDPTGRYRLVLLNPDWDHIAESFESRDRNEVRQTIELWLNRCESELEHQLERAAAR